MYRVILNWTGPVTGAATTTLHFGSGDGVPDDQAGAQDATDAAVQFFHAMRELWVPTEVVTASSTVDSINVVDGQIQTTFSVIPGDAQAGQGAGGFNRAAGVLVSWATGFRLAGRLVAGRTFIVPASGNVWTTAGVMDVAYQQIAQAAAAALIADPDTRLAVYQRPRTGQVGRSVTVTASAVPLAGAVLRSRRD